MGKNIKIELELPEFDKELVVSVVLKRDGEAITASSPAGVSATLQGDPGRTGYSNNSAPAWKQSPEPVVRSSGGSSGNMMDMNF